MKKWIVTITITLLAISIFPTKSQATDKDIAVADQLYHQGLEHLKKVYTQDDTFTDIDQNGKEYQHRMKKTLNVDVQYSSITEANEKYAQVIGELTAKSNYYKGQVGAEYLKVNIFKGNQLVAFYAIDENGDRTYHINGGFNLSSIGMGLPMSHQAYQTQLQYVEKAKKVNL